MIWSYGIQIVENNEERIKLKSSLSQLLCLSPGFSPSQGLDVLKKTQDFETDDLVQMVSVLQEELANFNTRALKYSENPSSSKHVQLMYAEQLQRKMDEWIFLFPKTTEDEIQKYFLYHGAIFDDMVPSITHAKAPRDNSPRSIKALLDRRVVGQEQAKKTLSFAMYLHLLRTGETRPEITSNPEYVIPEPDTKLLLPKPTVLLVGPTGSGKTFILKTLCDLFSIPFIKVDCASMTSSGYVGKGLDEYMQTLYEKCGQDIKKMGKSIIYFDEIDKLSEQHYERGSGSVGGRELQQEFLTFLEDKEIFFQQKKPNSGSVSLNAENLMFVFSGSFKGIKKAIQKRTRAHASIGFGGKAKSDLEKTDWISKVRHEDLIDFGMIDELVGRLNYIVPLKALTKIDVKEILIEAEGSPLQAYKNFFRLHMDELILTDEVVDLIAEKVVGMKTGGRSIVTILQALLNDLLYASPNEISEKFVIDKKHYQSIFPDNE